MQRPLRAGWISPRPELLPPCLPLGAEAEFLFVCGIMNVCLLWVAATEALLPLLPPRASVPSAATSSRSSAAASWASQLFESLLLALVMIPVGFRVPIIFIYSNYLLQIFFRWQILPMSCFLGSLCVQFCPNWWIFKCMCVLLKPQVLLLLVSSFGRETGSGVRQSGCPSLVSTGCRKEKDETRLRCELAKGTVANW